MVKKYITNEMLSNCYRHEAARFFGYGERQRAIAKSIKECPVKFFDYYTKHGNIHELDSKRNLKGISSKTLALLERIIEEKIGKVMEDVPETVKNKKDEFVVRMRPYTYKQ